MQIEIYGIKISLTFPFAAVVMLMLLLCDSDIVFMSLFSSLFHECGHLFFMLLFRDIPLRICFGAFGIRIERRKETFLSGKKEALIAMGGIIFNFLIILTGLTGYLVSGDLLFARLTAVNLFIALFNMLPVRLLDFGRCLEYLLYYSQSQQKSEKILNTLSVVTAIVVFIACLLYNIFIGVNVSMIAVSIYIILITTLKE